ncbi:MAG: glutamate mutase L [Firmicutes bacterium]|nr:glutamate mutase L [Bacillota bacterium]
MQKDEIQSILATDCGSTTTKAILIEKRDNEYRLIVRGEAPTTVEAPVEDVTRGVLNAATEVQELAGRPILTPDGENIRKPKKGNEGVDIYLSTSSAGGGLQMMVAGLVKQMTAESAARAALGAGAIVMDSLATNDGRMDHEKIARIRTLRPDMVLLAGGTDGGDTKKVISLAEIIAAADPKPRLGADYQLPVIFAGNKDCRKEVEEILGGKTALDITDNLRPSMEKENLMPSRQKIQKLFLEHVMSQAPGYPRLMGLVDEEIMPTPAAVGVIMQRIAKQHDITVVGVDIGGATTDVFSVFEGVFNRSVSANYGMSYSISNVFADAGLERILRWVPFSIDEKDLRNRIKNKMIRPTTIPQTLEELIIEQAASREALTLSFEQHKALATGLKGVQKDRSIADAFSQTGGAETLVNVLTLDMLIGSGGVLSHAPRRQQSAMMMMDAFVPEGVTRLTVDSIFMMPQLGVLSKVHPEAATQVFEKDCIIYLGTCIAPIGTSKEGTKAIDGTITMQNGSKVDFEVNFGDIKVIPLMVGEKAKMVARPYKGLDLGQGKNKEIEADVYGGVVGVIIDARGRPLVIPEDNSARVDKLVTWYKAMDLYPLDQLRSK